MLTEAVLLVVVVLLLIWVEIWQLRNTIRDKGEK
jgi:hypothetical protein